MRIQVLLKKIYISFLTVLVASTTALAQEVGFAKNRVALELSDVMGLELYGTSSGMVNFEFKSVDDYQNGVSILMKDHLVVTSNRKFNVVARAATKNFTAGGFDFIPVSVLRIDVANTEIQGNYSNLPIEHLSTIDRPLLLQVPPLLNKFLNIRYSIPSMLVNRHLLGKQPGLYTNAIIYTLTIQ